MIEYIYLSKDYCHPAYIPDEHMQILVKEKCIRVICPDEFYAAEEIITADFPTFRVGYIELTGMYSDMGVFMTILKWNGDVVDFFKWQASLVLRKCVRNDEKCVRNDERRIASNYRKTHTKTRTS